MKNIQQARPINQTTNALQHQQAAEERMAHKRDRDEHYNAKVKIAVIERLD